MAENLSHSVSTPVPEGRGGALDALRFVAALLIVVYHFGGDAPVALDTLHPVFDRGYLATDFFLILSGFVLGRAYGAQVLSGRTGLGGFLKKRVAPRNPEHYTPLAMAMQALLVQAWGLPGGGGWNQQSWSLSALIVCYAGFPLAWRWISKMTSPSALLALGLG